MTGKAVVLLSGGLDSATVLAIAQAEGFEACALTFRYGQRQQAEIGAARRIATRAALVPPMVPRNGARRTVLCAMPAGPGVFMEDSTP